MPVVTEPNSLLNDLYLKKQSILRIAEEIGSMASELREARAQMAKKEEILQQETGGRQVKPQYLHLVTIVLVHHNVKRLLFHQVHSNFLIRYTVFFIL